MGRGAAPACTLLMGVAAFVFCSPAAGQVYKCTQEGGRVLYSDVPCKGGAVVDVHAGTANPAAVRELARDNAAFDRKMAARRAAEDQAELRRRQLDTQLELARAAQGSPTASYGGPGYYAPGYAFVTPPRVKRHTPSHHDTHAPERRVPASAPPPGGLRRQKQ